MGVDPTWLSFCIIEIDMIGMCCPDLRVVLFAIVFFSRLLVVSPLQQQPIGSQGMQVS